MIEMTEEDVEYLAGAATRSPDPVAEWALVPCGRTTENMTTRGLARLVGTLQDGTPWSVFGKSLRPASESPQWAWVPEAFRDAVLEDLNWLDEPRVYRSRIAAAMPAGLRMPALLRIDERASSITLWLEDACDTVGWDVDRYRRTARLLGGLAGLRDQKWVTDELGAAPRPISRLFYGKITNFDLVLMAGDEFWAAPTMTDWVDGSYRADLGRLALAMPNLLDRLDDLPHGLSHGDAAPDNFLDGGDGVVVAIDWSYASLAPIGSDLGQLVAGRVEVEDRTASGTIELVDTVISSFVEGLTDAGRDVDPVSVREACVTYLATRFVFSALLAEGPETGGTPSDQEVMKRRATLGRVGLDLALAVL